MRLTLVLGTRNASSWSFRAWLVLRLAKLSFEEVVIAMSRPDTADRIARWSPSGRVPVLLVDDRPIWDSLAISEFAAELCAELWPSEQLARAHARSVSAEMHSGFAELRSFMPMDFTARFEPPGRLLTAVARDISRIEAIWTDCRRRYAADGPYLFGQFSIADAMYAPVVSRFVTYAIELGPAAAAYAKQIQQLPLWTEWAAAAEAEAGAERPDSERAETDDGAIEAARFSLPDRSLEHAPPHLAQPGGRDPAIRHLRAVEVKPIGGGTQRRR
jgi:glutathione S-transferase